MVAAVAAEAGAAFCRVSVQLRDGVSVAVVDWPSLAVVAVERYASADEARQVVGRRNVELMRP